MKKKIALSKVKQGGASLFTPPTQQHEAQETALSRVSPLPEKRYDGPYPPEDRPTICCGINAWVWNGTQYKCATCYVAETPVSDVQEGHSL